VEKSTKKARTKGASEELDKMLGIQWNIHDKIYTRATARPAKLRGRSPNKCVGNMGKTSTTSRKTKGVGNVSHVGIHRLGNKKREPRPNRVYRNPQMS
jgi:hypothetical protein